MKKQKNSKWFFILSFLVMLALPIVAALSYGAGYTAFGCIVSVVLGLIGAISAKKDFSHKYCQKCKQQFMPDDIGYNEISRRTKRYRRPEAGKGNPAKLLQEVAFAKILFKCQCPNCGNEQSFKDEYQMIRLYWDGHVEECNVEKNIDKYFITKTTGVKTGLALMLLGGVFAVIIAVIGAFLFG